MTHLYLEKVLCRNNEETEEDRFVGLKVSYTNVEGKVESKVEVIFPFCYKLGDNDETVREDILLLLNTLQQHRDHAKGETIKNSSRATQSVLTSYLYVIKDFLLHGYFKETETVYKHVSNGKINWHRTIKKCKPYISDNNVYYLDFITRSSNIKDNELITLVHEYCVYKSFSAIGWLYSSSMPKKSRIPFNKELFVSVLSEKLSSTYNDKHKLLFNHLLAIVQDDNLFDVENNNFEFGTDRFEHCWESMLDTVYGESNIDKYFASTYWQLGGKFTNKYPLRPDSIMLHNKDIFVLDGKYYRYGATGNPNDLPGTASVNKQITYGEYIHNKYAEGENKVYDNVYNAFLIPFDKDAGIHSSENNVKHFGQALSDWKEGSKEPYVKIQGILVDLKHLMQIASSKNFEEIKLLSQEIVDGFNKLNPNNPIN